MANRDEPQGFRPKGEPLRLNKYVAAGVIYPGDAVMQESGGRMIVGAASNALAGVAASYASQAGDPVEVWDDPEQLYIVQASGSEIDAQTDIGLNYNLLATAGSSTYRVSRQEMDSSTGDVTATLPLKLLGIDERPNNALGAKVDCIVKINNHQLAGGTGTLGV